MTPFYNFRFFLRQIVEFNKADIPLLDDPCNKITVTRQYNNSFVNKQNDQQTNKVSLLLLFGQKNHKAITVEKIFSFSFAIKIIVISSINIL